MLPKNNMALMKGITALSLAGVILMAGMMAGCTSPFGDGSDSWDADVKVLGSYYADKLGSVQASSGYQYFVLNFSITNTGSGNYFETERSSWSVINNQGTSQVFDNAGTQQLPNMAQDTYVPLSHTNTGSLAYLISNSTVVALVRYNAMGIQREFLIAPDQ